MRVFLDANVLFSAVKSDGAVRELLDRLLDSGHHCCADAFVIEEARRNLEVMAPDRVAQLSALVARIHVAELRSDSPVPAAVSSLPEKDRPVLAAAIGHGCEALVTGDRTHFGAYYGKAIEGVTIHSPRSLAEALFG
jgi:predicted nucleic acid-binding protein